MNLWHLTQLITRWTGWVPECFGPLDGHGWLPPGHLCRYWSNKHPCAQAGSTGVWRLPQQTVEQGSRSAHWRLGPLAQGCQLCGEGLVPTVTWEYQQPRAMALRYFCYLKCSCSISCPGWTKIESRASDLSRQRAIIGMWWDCPPKPRHAELPNSPYCTPPMAENQGNLCPNVNLWPWLSFTGIGLNGSTYRQSCFSLTRPLLFLKGDV